MVVVPNSRIRLLKSPIELDNRNQLTFSNETAQRNYFLSLPYLEYDECTYQRKDGVIRFETNDNITYEDLLGYNYCMYQNTSYGNKWFYAFITEVTYKNDGLTELKIETDVIQTWKFEINYKPSFIVREHVSNDSLGLHTFPEGLETGEYTEVGIDTYADLLDTCTVMAVTNSIEDVTQKGGSFMAGKYEGVHYYIFQGALADHYYPADQLSTINAAIERYSGRQEAITSLFMAPKKLVDYVESGPWTIINGTTIGFRPAFSGGMTPRSLSDFAINRPTSIGSYYPRNNKVLCFPYNYLVISNNNGSTAIYHYEDFTYSNENPNTLKFGVKGAITPGCSIRANPLNYKGQGENYLEGISAGKFPICSWQNDIYTNWLTQNGVNFAIAGATRLAGVAGGIAMIATGGGALAGAGLIAGSVGAAFNDVKTIYEHSFTPPQAEGDLGSGEISFSSGKNTFEAHKFQIREEYARIIDNFFTMYGYKVNTLKIPSFETRSNWNYIKTNGLNITGDIPQEDMNKVKEIFDNGLTFWHNPSTFLDYSQSNSIV